MQRFSGLLVVCVAVVLNSQVTLASIQVEIGNNGSTGNHWLLGSGWGTGSGQLEAVFKIDPESSRAKFLAASRPIQIASISARSN